jgi:hypothetical protein
MRRRKTKYNWTDEELIEWCKTKTKRSDLKRENTTKYMHLLRRGLEEYLPGYVGSWTLRTMDPEAKTEVIKQRKSLSSPSRIYKDGNSVEGGVLCGRCLEFRTYTSKVNKLCKVCYNRTCTLLTMEKDINLWNIRDQFCNTKITHYEKVFEIGVKVDERTQNYLTMIGFGFIFKEIYDETSYHMKQK